MSEDPDNNEGQLGENPNPEEEEEKKDEEDEETIKNRDQLNKFKDDIKNGLSNISQIANNTSYAYVKLTLAEKELDKLFDPILQYKHLRYLDISSNQLADINIITNLRYLLSINVSKNQIVSLQVFNPESDEEVLPFLQFLNVSGNKLQSLENLKLKQLRRLIVSENEISTAENFEGHPTLEYLDLRLNKLKNFKGICNMPHLLELGAEENEISDFRDLQDLPLLRKLILSKNKIKKIKTPLPYLPSLYHLSVSENEIDKFKYVLKFSIMRTILSLSVQGNPLDVEDSKKELLMKLSYFERINDEEITQEDRLEAEKTLKERQEEEERKRQEEAEAKRLEMEAKLEAERQAKEAEEQLLKEQQLQQQQQQQAAEGGAGGVEGQGGTEGQGGAGGDVQNQ